MVVVEEEERFGERFLHCNERREVRIGSRKRSWIVACVRRGSEKGMGRSKECALKNYAPREKCAPPRRRRWSKNDDQIKRKREKETPIVRGGKEDKSS
jgi:hypothetical protein